MVSMKLEVMVDSLREAKTGGKCYTDLLFTGGRVNLEVSREHYENLKNYLGETVKAVFKMRVCEALDRYKNKVAAFQPVKILEIEG